MKIGVSRKNLLLNRFLSYLAGAWEAVEYWVRSAQAITYSQNMGAHLTHLSFSLLETQVLGAQMRTLVHYTPPALFRLLLLGPFKMK